MDSEGIESEQLFDSLNFSKATKMLNPNLNSGDKELSLSDIQSVTYQIGLSQHFRAKNTHIILEKKFFTMDFYNFFLNDPFSLTFPSLETITI